MTSNQEFKILNETVLIEIPNIERAQGHLLSLFSQSESDERKSIKRARSASLLVDGLATQASGMMVMPKNTFKLLLGKRVTFDPVFVRDAGYVSLASFVKSYETLRLAKNTLASSRKAQLFRPFLTDYNEGHVKYLPRDEHCYVRYSKTDSEIHLFRCFGGETEPDEVAVIDTISINTFPDVAPSIVVLPQDSGKPLSVPELHKAYPTNATSLEDLEKWLDSFGYVSTTLSKDDHSFLKQLLEDNVKAVSISAQKPTKKQNSITSPKSSVKWYGDYVSDTKAPDMGQMHILSKIGEQLHTLQNPKTTVSSLQAALEKLTKTPKPQDAITIDEHVHNVLDLYANMSKFDDNASVALSRFDGVHRYSLQRGVWRRMLIIPQVDLNAKQRLTLENALDAAKDREHVSSSVGPEIQALRSWSTLEGRLDIYKASKQQSVYVPSTKFIIEESFDNADNPLFYKAVDPYSLNGKVSLEDPKQTDLAPVDIFKDITQGIQTATSISLTFTGEQWMSANLEFYNSASTFRVQLKKEVDKLAATVQALENSPEWGSASQQKQQELRNKIKSVGDDRNAKLVSEFNERSMIIGASLFSMLMASASDLLDGTPELNPLCVPPDMGQGLSVLGQAQSYVMCSLAKARLIPSPKAAFEAVQSYTKNILHDKQPLSARLQSVLTAPWKTAQTTLEHKLRPDPIQAATPDIPKSQVAFILLGRALTKSSKHEASPSVDPFSIGHLHIESPEPVKHEKSGNEKLPEILRSFVKADITPKALSDAAIELTDRVSRRLLEMGIPAAASYRELMRQVSSVSLNSFVRSTLMPYLSRVGYSYCADSTARSKKYLDRNMQHAIEDLHVTECNILGEIERVGEQIGKTLRENHIEVMKAGRGNINTKDGAVALMSAIFLSILNMPSSKLYSVKSMLSTDDTDPSPAMRKIKSAVATYLMVHFMACVRLENYDIDNLKKSKMDARTQRDKKFLEQYDTLDDEFKQTIQIFKKMNFKEWKDLIPIGTEDKGMDDIDDTVITGIDSPDADSYLQEKEQVQDELDEGHEDAENDDEVEDDATTDGFVRDDS